MGAAGFDAENTQLIFVQRRHTAAYGTPNDGGVLAHVVGGKNTLDRLEAGDKIQGIEPIVEWQDLTEKLATTDLTLPLEDGMEIFTGVEAELIEDAPLGAEFFLALTRDGTFKVDSVSSSYISSDQLLTEPIVFEHREPRLEGVVTVRTSGRGLGRIFVYKQDRTSQSQPLRGGAGHLRNGYGEAGRTRPVDNCTGEAGTHHAHGHQPERRPEADERTGHRGSRWKDIRARMR